MASRHARVVPPATRSPVDLRRTGDKRLRSSILSSWASVFTIEVRRDNSQNRSDQKGKPVAQQWRYLRRRGSGKLDLAKANHQSDHHRRAANSAFCNAATPTVAEREFEITKHADGDAHHERCRRHRRKRIGLEIERRRDRRRRNEPKQCRALNDERDDCCEHRPTKPGQIGKLAVVAAAKLTPTQFGKNSGQRANRLCQSDQNRHHGGRKRPWMRRGMGDERHNAKDRDNDDDAHEHQRTDWQGKRSVLLIAQSDRRQSSFYPLFRPFDTEKQLSHEFGKTP